MKTLKIFILLTTLSAANLCVNAQSGPGGVGSSSVCALWLKANAGTSTTINGLSVSRWDDQSGNANDASQLTSNLQPIYLSSVMNGQPALLFDNSSNNSDQLLINDNNTLDQTNGLSFFAVVRPLGLGGSRNTVLSKMSGNGSEQAYSWFFDSTSKLTIDLDSNTDRFTTTSSFSPVTNYLLSTGYNGSLASGFRAKQYVGGTLDVTATESSSFISNKVSDLFIGVMYPGDTNPFNGYVSEVIIFRKALNSAERKITENYLSAKYDIATSVDAYTGDNPGTDYDENVAGVGKELDGANTSFDASVCGGLAMFQSIGFDDGDYILAGHQSGINSDNTIDVAGMSGLNNSRWERTWYLDITNTGASLEVDLLFDANNAGYPGFNFSVASNYVLLYRAALSGSWLEIATPNAVSSTIVSFSGLTLTNDGFYTLGTKNSITSPLSVQLVVFTGKSTGKSNVLNWSTSFEVNNKGFEIERMREGASQFEPIDFVQGSGTSISFNSYQYADDYAANAYYRLKQIDFNGSVEYSKAIYVESAHINKISDEIIAEAISVYPNPATSAVYIAVQSGDPGLLKINLIDLMGKVFECPVTQDRSGRKLLIDTGKLARGVYLIMIQTSTLSLSKKIIIETN